MDAILFIGIAVFMTIMSLSKPDVKQDIADIVKEDVTREAKLNDAYYEDQEAFMEIAHALGFPKGV